MNIMPFSWSLLLDAFSIVGFVTGTISFFVMLVKWRRERPILKVTVTDSYFAFFDTDEHGTTLESVIYVDLVVDNVGERDTTIKDVKVSKMDPSGLVDGISYVIFGDQFNLSAHSSREMKVEIHQIGVELAMRTLRVDLEVIHTHGKIKVETQAVKR